MRDRRLALDHLVIAAASLEQGVAQIRQLLGVELPFGGAHPRMGTHNCLTRIGDAAFLEIIAVDPAAPAPARPRWFALDDPVQRARLPERARLVAWVAGTGDLDGDLARCPELGRPREMTRGDLVWRIGLTDTGMLPQGGTLPVLIQWPQGPHPAGRVADLGLRLERLRLLHPRPEWLRARLTDLGADGLATVEATDGEPRIEAELRTAAGAAVTLS